MEMDSLPIEILENILSHLPLIDKLKLEIVCKSWRYVLLNSYQNVNGLLISFDGRKIIHLACLRDEKCIDKFTDNGRSSEVWCPEDNIRILINRCGIHLKRFEINFETIRCFRLSVLNFLYQCENLRIINFHGLDLWPISNVKDIRNEYRVFGYISILESLRDLTLSYPANHQICFNISPILSETLMYLANLKKLKLENAEIHDSLFIPLCQKLSSSLEFFCFKEKLTCIQRDTLLIGLKSLINIKHLNLGGCVQFGHYQKSVASKLDDDVISELSVIWTKLETFNLHGACNVTSNGISCLLNSDCGKYSLRHLGLVSCRKVDDSLSEAVFNRCRENDRVLKINAHLTNISTTMIRNILFRNNKRRHSIEICVGKNEVEEEVFFGESSTVCVCEHLLNESV